MITTIEDFRARAEIAAKTGDAAQAAAVFGEAVAAYPTNAALWNSAANASLRAGDFAEAADRFAKARELAPTSLEFAVNHAIALGRQGNHAAALTELEKFEDLGANDVRYCSARANASRNRGILREAARWYDRALKLDPAHTRSRHGRARVALERAEPDAIARFDHALACSPGDPELWLGKAQALDVAGQTEEARAIAQSLVEQAPQWPEGLRFLSQLLLGEGETDFAAPYRAAAKRLPWDPEIPLAHCSVLASLDRSAEAADIAADARRQFPEDERFALLEAIHAGEAGQTERADALWARMPIKSTRHALHEARHRLRLERPDLAKPLIESALAENPSSVTAWALRGLVWRLLEEPRAAWLHEQPGLVQFLPLRGSDELLPGIISRLHEIHDGSPLPLGQSLRGGSQTRGGLFDRHEAIWRELHSAVLATLEDYRANLPAEDVTHPLLRYRSSIWRVAGSWSVRLSSGGDHHTSHIHPQGMISSALYLELPSDLDTSAGGGWLEIGRPPADLRLDLPPLHSIRPCEGHLALFSSTLYHGTTPFSGGRRMTVAFDVQSNSEGLP